MSNNNQKEELNEKDIGKEKADQESNKNDYVDKAKENIESGTEAVKDKFGEIADKTVDTAGEVYESVKKGLSTAYDSGSKLFDELTKTAQEYVDRFNDNMDMRKLSEERDNLTKQLGQATYINYKVNIKVPQKLSAEKNIVELIVKIESLDKEIIAIGKKLGK